MPSTTRYLTILALGSVLSLTGTLAAEKGHEKENKHENHGSQVSTFPGGIDMWNPCPEATSPGIHVDGTNVTRYHENKNYGFIRVRFIGKGSDDAGQPVTAYLWAQAKVDPPSSFYDVPLESIWVDKGTHNFEFSSNLRVTVATGADGRKHITSANIWPIDGKFSLQCTADTGLAAAEHSFTHDKDNDEDDDKD